MTLAAAAQRNLDLAGGSRRRKRFPLAWVKFISPLKAAPLLISFRTVKTISGLSGFIKEYKLIRGEFRLTRVTNRNGNVLLLIYENGFLAKMQNANHWITLTRGKKGHILLAQDDQARKVSYAYDEKGRLIEADDLGGNAWKYSYGDDRRLVSATDPLQRLNFAVSFDRAGRVARLQLPSGTIQYLYDPASRSTTVIDRKQLTSRFFQNEEDITTRVVNALGEETSVTPDSGRNVVSLARNGLIVERMQYDQQHRLVFRQSITGSGTVNREYVYDPVTGLLSGIHPSGDSDQSFAYDPQGNLSAAALSDGPHTFEYSSAGDLTRFSLQTTNITFTADPDGLIASMTDEQKAVSTMQYKAGGELAVAAFPDGTRAQYEYQPSGLRAALQYKDGRRVEYGYDPAGNLTSTKVFDAKGKQVNGQKLQMNGSYQLTRWVLFDGTETTFEYDANGNLTQIAKGESITRFQYDALDRLVAVDTPDGQRLTYTYKPGERSLVEQYEHASVPVVDLRDTGFTFSRPFATMDSRPLTAPFGAVRFSESLGSFQLANPDGSEIVRPHEGIESALSKLHLFQTGVTQKALRSGFNAPFNNMFVPAEYFTINCCPECYYSSGRWICPPCEPPPPPPPPSVSISGPAYVPLRTGASTGPNSMTLTSSVNPSGGTYSWTTSSNKVSLSNTSSANVTVTSAAASTASGDVPITLTYTVNGQSASATVNITVRKPSSLQLVSGSDTTDPAGHTCTASPTSNTCQQSHFPGSGMYTSYLRNRAYHIMDQFSPPQWIQGYALDIQESYTAPTGQCAGDSVVTSSGAGDTATDCFYFCSATCQSGGSCSVSATQTVTINGFSIGTESVTWTCSGVTIQP